MFASLLEPLDILELVGVAACLIAALLVVRAGGGMLFALACPVAVIALFAARRVARATRRRPQP